VAQPEAQPSFDPAAVAQKAELIARVGAAVQALHEPLRTAVVMRFWHGMLPDAIAQQLGVPRNTVRSRLQRGLELLRERLDREFGTRERWTKPLGAIAGVRAAVPAATSGAMVMLFTGWLMNTKLLLGAAAVLVAAVAIPWSLAGERGGPGTPPTVSGSPNAVVASAAPPPNERIEQPLPAIASGAGEEPFDPAPVHVAPWTPDILVVDEDDLPVTEAIVTIWASTKVERSAEVRKQYGGSRHAYQGHAENPTLRVHTDEDGRARPAPVLDLESYAFAASKDGIGNSAEAPTWYTRKVEVKLVLARSFQVRGQVLRADGSPGVGATVTAGPSFYPTPQSSPAPVVTDAEGRFAMALQGRGKWDFRANLDGQTSLPNKVQVLSEPVPEVVISFPGAINLTGLVVDADGKPVPQASVRAWREYRLNSKDQDPDDYETGYADADDAGRFTIAVQRCARYELLASQKGHATSELVWTETTREKPHAEVRLVLQRFAEIRGRVLHENGTPFAGVRVVASAEAGEAAGYAAVPTRRDLFEQAGLSTSAADGAFLLQVHPGTSWTLITRPVPDQWHIGTKMAGVAPGRRDVDLVITADDLGGCTVRGSVLSAADGTEIADCGFELVTYDKDGVRLSSAGVKANVHGNQFTLPPLPCGRRFGLRVYLNGPENRPDGSRFPSMDGPFAPREIGPFTTSRQGLELVVRLDVWGDLPVRVLASDGSVPRGVSVVAWSAMLTSISWPALHLDHEGRALLRGRDPGLHHLRVLVGERVIQEQDVTIAPGLNQELEVRLPAAAALPGKR
jgi:hypothetical protein